MSHRQIVAPTFGQIRSDTLPAFASAVKGLLFQLDSTLRALCKRASLAILVDGSEPMEAPLQLASYAKAALPSAATYVRGLIYVTDDIGGATPAFSDGTNWRRTADRNVIS